MWFFQIISGFFYKNISKQRASLKDNLQAMQYLPKFLYMIWQTNPFLASVNIILRIFKAFLPVLALYVGKLITDEVVAIIEQKTVPNQLFTLILIEFGIALLADILSRIIFLADALLGDLFANKSSLAIMKHASEADLAQLEDATFYDKLDRARKQTIGRVSLMSQVFAQMQDFITILFLAVSLAIFNAWLILLLLLAVIPSFLNETYFNSYSYSLSRNRTPERRELDYIRYIGASDETAKEIKVFGLSHFLYDRFAKLSEDYYLLNKNLSVKRAIWGAFFSVIGSLGYYIAYILIVYQTIQGKITLGDLTFLVGSFRNLSNLLQAILNRLATISQNSLFLQDLFVFLETKPHIISAENPQPIPNPIKQGFTFVNVGFKYANATNWAVRNLNFELKAGEKLALVGENGAGKTTLVKLLARLYDCSEGQILLDGVDIRKFRLEDLRQLIGVVFQDFVHFQMTATENIAVGNIKEKNNITQIEQAAHKSLAHTVIEKLPKGYAQLLGKKFAEGIELSGGQWQKIALARAYMRDAQVIILDEPTAALDARAEFEVFQRFAELTQGKTAVLISHRFSTVRMADKILVLKQGQMQEWGTHEELLAQKGLYAELFHLQAKGYL